MRYLAWICVLAPLSAAAQTSASSAPGPYVVDLRAAFSGLPQDPSFLPPVPSGTIVPTRGLGFEVGAHVYLIGLGASRLGIGASLMQIRARSSVEVPRSASSTPAAAPAHPDIETTFRTIAPQLSLNFGSRDGWSYVSAGVGQAQVKTEATAFSGSPSVRTVEGTPPRSVNVGGGARWFTSRHLAFSFDLRFHVVSASRGDVPTPRTTLVAASGGISLK